MTAPTDDELIAELRKPWRQLGNGPVMRSHLQCSAADRLVELLAENEALRRNHLGEGTFRCTCTSYPHAPNCGLDERLAAALERERKLREDNDILRATCTAREEYAADIATLRADAERMRAALHTSAPSGYKCADCSIDCEPCPQCYSAWWKRTHPMVQISGSVDDDTKKNAQRYLWLRDHTDPPHGPFSWGSSKQYNETWDRSIDACIAQDIDAAIAKGGAAP